MKYLRINYSVNMDSNLRIREVGFTSEIPDFNSTNMPNLSSSGD